MMKRQLVFFLLEQRKPHYDKIFQQYDYILRSFLNNNNSLDHLNIYSPAEYEIYKKEKFYNWLRFNKFRKIVKHYALYVPTDTFYYDNFRKFSDVWADPENVLQQVYDQYLDRAHIKRRINKDFFKEKIYHGMISIKGVEDIPLKFNTRDRLYIPFKHEMWYYSSLDKTFKINSTILSNYFDLFDYYSILVNMTGYLCDKKIDYDIFKLQELWALPDILYSMDLNLQVNNVNTIHGFLETNKKFVNFQNDVGLINSIYFKLMYLNIYFKTLLKFYLFTNFQDFFIYMFNKSFILQSKKYLFEVQLIFFNYFLSKVFLLYFFFEFFFKIILLLIYVCFRVLYFFINFGQINFVKKDNLFLDFIQNMIIHFWFHIYLYPLWISIFVLICKRSQFEEVDPITIPAFDRIQILSKHASYFPMENLNSLNNINEYNSYLVYQVPYLPELDSFFIINHRAPNQTELEEILKTSNYMNKKINKISSLESTLVNPDLDAEFYFVFVYSEEGKSTKNIYFRALSRLRYLRIFRNFEFPLEMGRKYVISRYFVPKKNRRKRFKFFFRNMPYPNAPIKGSLNLQYQNNFMSDFISYLYSGTFLYLEFFFIVYISAFFFFLIL